MDKQRRLDQIKDQRDTFQQQLKELDHKSQQLSSKLRAKEEECN